MPRFQSRRRKVQWIDKHVTLLLTHLLQCQTMPLTRYTAFAGLVAPLLLSVLAHAESAENIAAARALAAKGVKLARAGDCQGAIDPLQRAEQLYHAPSILVELGACQCELGELVEGTEALNRVVRENLGDDAPQAFVDAQGRARTLLEQYRPKLAQLVIAVEAPDGSTYVVKVDEKEVPEALMGVPRPTDPGEHTVSASGEGLISTQRTVTLKEGGSDEVTLTLTLDPNPSRPAAIPPPEEPREINVVATPVDTGSPTSRGDSLVPAYIALGIGAVGIGAGTYFGITAINQKKDLDLECQDGSCPTGTQEDIDTMHRNANLSTLGMGIGVVGAGVGLYLLLTAEGNGSQATCTETPCVTPLLGLGRLGMEGVF